MSKNRLVDDFKTGVVRRDIQKNYVVYLMLLPVLVYYIAFCYKPMLGMVIAFKNYNPNLGIWGSQWVGLKHFKSFFEGYYFKRLLLNTLRISFSNLIFGFPMPIILALLINELRSRKYAKVVQTVSYLPHFISVVVVCGMLKNFLTEGGMINDLLAMLGAERQNYLLNKNAFVPIYVASDIWQSVGWDSIVYLAALTAVDLQLYEAAVIDGAGRWHQLWHITLPSILPTIFIMLLLRIGNIMGVGYEKVILLYNSAVYETADIISSYVYRKGLQEFNWSFSTAVGCFNSVINFLLLITSNIFSKKLNGTGLW